MFDFYRFYRGYGRLKRGAPPGENGKKQFCFSIFNVLPRIWQRKRGAPPVKTVKMKIFDFYRFYRADASD